jgi:hypothetical protein
MAVELSAPQTAAAPKSLRLRLIPLVRVVLIAEEIGHGTEMQRSEYDGGRGAH